MHHVAKLPQEAQANAHVDGITCVVAATQAVRIAQILSTRGLLNEAYALTVDILVLAATTLLAVECRAPKGVSTDMLRRTSHSARSLLEGLAQHSDAAEQCLESLLVSAAFCRQPNDSQALNMVRS